MTSKLTSNERLAKILSETQATIMEHNSRCVRGSVEVDARLFEAINMELQELRKAEMDSEPVAWFNGCNKSAPEALRYLAENPRPIGGESSFNTTHLYQLAREIELMAEAPLYRHAQPEPDDVLNRLEHEANHITAWHHMDEHSCKVNRRDLLTLVNSCRAAMLQAANSPVIPDGYVMVPKDVSPEQLRAFQLKTKIGAYVTANWSDAYDSLRELWNEVIAHYCKSQDDGLKK